MPTEVSTMSGLGLPSGRAARLILAPLTRCSTVCDAGSLDESRERILSWLARSIRMPSVFSITGVAHLNFLSLFDPKGLTGQPHYRSLSSDVAVQQRLLFTSPSETKHAARSF